MTIQQIADELVTMFNRGDIEDLYQKLYSPEIVSVEPTEPMKVMKGFDQVMEKGKWWQENFEVHSTSMSRPVVADDFFSVAIRMDTTHKPSGMRSEITEIGVYQVADGKIIREEFFYTSPQEDNK